MIKNRLNEMRTFKILLQNLTKLGQNYPWLKFSSLPNKLLPRFNPYLKCKNDLYLLTNVLVKS